MFSIASAKTTRLVLVPLLVLWTAGTGCLIGCERMVMAVGWTADNAHAVNTVVADACASQSGHDCCAKSAKRSASTVQSVVNDSANDFVLPVKDPSEALACPLAVNRMAVIWKAGSIEPPADATIAQQAPTDSSSSSRASGASPYLIPPNRGHTYLRCCVFLI